MPSTPRPRPAVKSSAGFSTLVASNPSLPQMTLSTAAHSPTVFEKGPIWSRLDANATMPKRDTRPYVGFIATVPVSEPGWRIDPPVSLPSESVTMPAATAAALPPLLPPGTRSRSHGLCVGPNAEFSVDEPNANSSMLHLPIGRAPALSMRETAVQS
jgi:hypothetical protein